MASDYYTGPCRKLPWAAVAESLSAAPVLVGMEGGGGAEMLTIRWGRHYTRYSWLRKGPGASIHVGLSGGWGSAGHGGESFPESRDFSARDLSTFVLVSRTRLAHQGV